MKRFLQHRTLIIFLAALVIVSMLIMLYRVSVHEDTSVVSTIVELGDVRELVSVSGVVEATKTVDLAFPLTGIVREVSVSTGDMVAAGAILARLDTRSLQADRADALAALAKVSANRDELLSGPTASARTVASETVAAKQVALETTRANEARKVENSYQTFLSSDLAAYATEAEEAAVAPVVTGTYTCDTEGTYEISVFSSNTDSGYSYQLSGLETGIYTASTEQPVQLGTCGLRIQFDENSRYGRTSWYIPVPNTESSTYITNKNAYTLAVTQAESAIRNAERALTLATASAANDLAPARSEAVARAHAAVAQAAAQVSRIDAAIDDRTLRAPFAGIITDIDILPGETVSTAPVVTLLASEQFEMVARIPEIDIGKLLPGQSVEMIFDAQPRELQQGTITFISPQATEIDGVAYYEAHVTFANIPPWLRSGLNADIEVIINEATDVLRVPKRFIKQTAQGPVVLLQRNNATATTTIEILLSGNDGFSAITGVNEGDTLIAP